MNDGTAVWAGLCDGWVRWNHYYQRPREDDPNPRGRKGRRPAVNHVSGEEWASG